jgi:DNA-damage-inducible protein J
MAKTAELKVRLEPLLKRKAAAVYKNWGLNLSDAVTVFLSQSVIEGGLPFRMEKAERPNAATRMAMEDVRLGRDLSRPFDSAEEMLADILKRD